MSVKIRLSRRGRKKMAMYDIVVADARSPRDGKLIEKLGNYNPNVNPAKVTLDDDKAFDWLMKGAQPTDTARTILSTRGIMLRKHLQLGVIKGAITEAEATKRLDAWKAEKETKLTQASDKIWKDADAVQKATQKAETEARVAKEEEIKKKQAAAIAAEEEANAEASAEEAPADDATEAPVAEEAKVEETPAEEPKAKEEAPKVEEAPVAKDAATEAPAEAEPKA